MSQGASLRDQQAEFTKRLLLDAARKVIADIDPDEFTMQKVAEEAGVSHRTVYRYFPSRQALLDQFAEFLESEFGYQNHPPPSLDNAEDVVHMVFRKFDENAADYEAAAKISGGDLRPANHAERTAYLWAEFQRIFPGMEPDAAKKSFAIIRYLIGLHTWYSLRQRFHLGHGETGDAVAWAVSVLMDALHAENLPGSNREQDTGTT